LTDEDFSPVTIGGTPLSEMATLGDALATVVIGPSLIKAAELLEERTGVPTYSLDHLYGLKANDALISALAEISGWKVPERIEKAALTIAGCHAGYPFYAGSVTGCHCRGCRFTECVC